MIIAEDFMAQPKKQVEGVVKRGYTREANNLQGRLRKNEYECSR